VIKIVDYSRAVVCDYTEKPLVRYIHDDTNEARER